MMRTIYKKCSSYVRTKADEDMLSSATAYRSIVYRRQTHALHIQQREQAGICNDLGS